MAKMSIGGSTLTRNPSRMTAIEKDRYSAAENTFTDVAFFSWGASLIGKRISLSWGFMSITEFNTLQGLYEADATVVLNAQDGSGKSYNVEIVNFFGEYHITLASSGAGYRKNVQMELIIISQVGT